MKRTARIIFVMLILIVLFSVSAFAISDDIELLRAGGGGGGGGGGFGGGSRFFRRNYNTVDPITTIIVEVGYYLFTVGGPLIAAFLLVMKIKSSKKKSKKIMDKLAHDDAGWSYEAIHKQVKNAYFTIQKAWTEGDMRPARDMMSEKLFLEFQEKLGEMKKDRERNVLKNIKLLEACPVSVNDFKQDVHDYVWYYIKGSMIDYHISLDTQKIIIGDRKPRKFIEYWRFNRTADGTFVLAEILQEREYAEIKFQSDKK